MRIDRCKKGIAAFFLLVFSLQLVTPTVAYALTSGPKQPEMLKFEPAGTSDMVDLFSGDMKYNIPLMDVGYPINLAYNSGTGMDEEASWVGTGWTLNPGAVNRTLRGLPDDFDGSQGDKISKDYHRKEFKKIGGQIVLKPSLFSWEIGKASLKINVYKDNYYGIGASVGAGMDFNLAKNSSSELTAGLGLDVNSDVRNGVDISPSLSLSASHDDKMERSTGTLSGAFTYNTRAGLKNTSLTASFSTTEDYKNSKYADYPSSITASAEHYFGQSYTPSIATNTSNTGYTFSFDLGPSVFAGFIGIGGAGYVYREHNLEPTVSVPAFGYLNYPKGREKLGALLDFNREKDGVFIKSAPSIAIPVATNDFFTASGQTGTQQFRPYFGGNYTAFDRIHSNTNINASAGVTVGGGNVFKGGARINYTNGQTISQKWTKNNLYLAKAEAAVSSSIDAEPVYFKQVGEKTTADYNFYNKFGNTATSNVGITGQRNNGAIANAVLRTRGSALQLGEIRKDNREKRNYGFSYLTTEQAQRHALDKELKSYNATGTASTAIPRTSGQRKPHHISEITVNDAEGKRMVYGIPVNNLTQKEFTFSVAAPDAANLEKIRRTGLVGYTSLNTSRNNNFGRDNLYTKETTPSYSTSYLLTGILSPDYVDRTGNGISDDDAGTAVKFNYSKLTTDANIYKWRTPFESMTANYNEGFISDPKDDKANFVYGEKEIWYLKSVESKTMVAVFETSDRDDGLGVASESGGIGSLKLKKLDQIKLYSKADWIKNGVNAVPVKVAHFVYDYSLYPGVRNNINNRDAQTNAYVPGGAGKLTLRSVYFTFGTGNRGQSNPYQFSYDMLPVTDNITNLPPITGPDEELNDGYLERNTDRWGSYKKSFYNRIINNQRTFNNSEFPYSLQENDLTNYSERDLANRFASKWQLTRIVTPSSGIIDIQYESDDYAFVQDRRAMQMCFVKGIDAPAPENQSVITGLVNHGKSGVKKLLVELPRAVSTDPSLGKLQFQKLYMTGADGDLADKVFYKIFTDLNGTGKYEYVQGYAPVNWANTSAAGNIAYIALNTDGEYNPIAKAAWQMLKTDLPQYAYNSYDNADTETFGEDFSAAIRSIIAALGNFSELVIPFEKKADRKGFADNIDITKSMVRLNTPPHSDPNLANADRLAKLGGGSRVRKIQISDDWEAMTGTSGAKAAKYGQLYQYNIKMKDGSFISSGVASYEPHIGNEENPFHEPINFTEKVHWSTDRNHFIEKPFCETYFPAASVGYSNVSVTSFGDDYDGNGAVVNNSTGHIESEYYTAKDFPTKVDYLALEKEDYENSLIMKLFSSRSIHRVANSQGFRVELNDMHGKPKSVKVFNKGGDLVSSSEYMYRVKDQNAGEKELNNDNIDVLQTNEDAPGAAGLIVQKTLATEIDFTTDLRESVSESTGYTVGAYTGSMVIPLAFFPLYFPYFAVNYSRSRTFDTYNSASAVKVINRFGILSKVVTTQNGSTIEAENLLWDGLTGEVLLTKTQNEFDKSTYAFTYPAHMVAAYEGMGAAYKNLGITFLNFNTGTDGRITSLTGTEQNNFLFPGDELIKLQGFAQRGWIIRSADASYRLIDENGAFITTTGAWQIARSGRRNMLAAGTGSVITMNDPRVNGTLALTADKRILDSKAIEYQDQWAVPVAPKTGLYTDCSTSTSTSSSNQNALVIIPGSTNSCTCKCLKPFFDYLIYSEQLFINQSQNITVQSLVNEANGSGNPLYTVGSCPIIDQNSTKPFYALTSNSFSNIYTAKMGDCTVSIRSVDNSPVTFYNLLSQPCGTTPVVNFTVQGSQTTLATLTVDGCNNCQDPVGQTINPYYTGVLGNWRPVTNYVYTVNRQQKAGNINQTGGTDIRNAGYYQLYSPFWDWQNAVLQRTFTDAEYASLPGTDARSRWVWSNKSVYYDQKGNEIESVDALARYGSALFGYSQSAATAVSANARHNEIMFDGFEDYDFDLKNPGDPAEVCPARRQFDFDIVNQNGVWKNGANQIVSSKSHTGKNSYQVNGTVSVTKPAGLSAPPTTALLSYDGPGRYLLNSNELANGFAPVNGKKYLFSCWVYDNSPATNTLNGVTVSVNGQSPGAATVVEGWKRIEVPFTAGPTFTLNITGSNIYVDDIRILPFDGQMSSYVYDNRTMRLMAQLDENNFATLYEYDDEGTPVRVKKETERGVMTLKENRQSLRKRN